MEKALETSSNDSNKAHGISGVFLGSYAAIVTSLFGLFVGLSLFDWFVLSIGIGLLLGAFLGGIVTGWMVRKRGVLLGIAVSTSISLPTARLLGFLPWGEPPSVGLRVYSQVALIIVATLAILGAAGGWTGVKLARRKINKRRRIHSE